jgi:predicted dehydrogenase
MSALDRSVRVALIGCGERGSRYFEHIGSRVDMAVVGVWDLDPSRMDRLCAIDGDNRNHRMRAWDDVDGTDAIIVATSDNEHLDLALKYASIGLPVLVEKPLCRSLSELERLANTPGDLKAKIFVAHSLRYTAYSQAISRVVRSGRIGSILGMQHAEPVSFGHFAHSYVRGKWSIDSQSGPLLLTKACHDIDLVGYWTGLRVVAVASMGSLSHYHAASAPPGASQHCTDCGLSNDCIFASDAYLEMFDSGVDDWRLLPIADQFSSRREFAAALAGGPYGRCVYACDNDVVDSQVVMLELDNGAIASVTVVGAGRSTEGRRTTIYGSAGELIGNERSLVVHDFATNTSRMEKFPSRRDLPIDALLGEFKGFVLGGDNSANLDDAIESHNVVLSAELARVSRRSVDVGALVRPWATRDS